MTGTGKGERENITDVIICTFVLFPEFVQGAIIFFFFLLFLTEIT